MRFDESLGERLLRGERPLVDVLEKLRTDAVAELQERSPSERVPGLDEEAQHGENPTIVGFGEKSLDVARVGALDAELFEFLANGLAKSPVVVAFEENQNVARL